MQETKTWFSQYDLWPYSPYITTCHMLSGRVTCGEMGQEARPEGPGPHRSHCLNLFASRPGRRGQTGRQGSYASAIRQCSRGPATLCQYTPGGCWHPVCSLPPGPWSSAWTRGERGQPGPLSDRNQGLSLEDGWEKITVHQPK